MAYCRIGLGIAIVLAVIAAFLIVWSGPIFDSGRRREERPGVRYAIYASALGSLIAFLLLQQADC
jgi:hypothetical protein